MSEYKIPQFGKEPFAFGDSLLTEKPADAPLVTNPVEVVAHDKKKKKLKEEMFAFRIDVELKRQFGEKCDEIGESQAMVMRRLMRFYLGLGPDPREGA